MACVGESVASRWIGSGVTWAESCAKRLAKWQGRCGLGCCMKKFGWAKAVRGQGSILNSKVTQAKFSKSTTAAGQTAG